MIHLITTSNPSKQLLKMVESFMQGRQYIKIDRSSKMPDMKHKKILFASELDEIGIDISIIEVFKKLYASEPSTAVPLQGSIAGILIHSKNELFTKSFSSHIVFLANQLGCRFIGHPMVEATGDLTNFRTWQKRYDMSLNDIALKISSKLGERFNAFPETNQCGDKGKFSLSPYETQKKRPSILALHASNRDTSNTLTLWNMVKKHLEDCKIDELHVQNGTIYDCNGCPFKVCLHYSRQEGCFYGGTITTEVFPAIEKADIVVWICPNYNDSISANLMSVVNRLTALYKKISLHDKSIFAIIVSGNSGGDSVAKQLISALNINKGFQLPPNFALIETANDFGAILRVKNIEDRAKRFAENIQRDL
ncbi:MAG: FMN reductase [Alkaliphilus sp.]|nr:NAD(P)H-dependent oxidoreductase [bacterium AH-315-L21]PHS33837.1 MAG: FMN reductase [Alkaliphilus sp.]